ncbi:MAG: FHA domain-containing protein [Mycobacteriales bacterium]
MTQTPLRLRWASDELVVQPGTEVSIGRAPENTITLSSSAVSRRHARLAHSDDGWVLYDLASTQGTFVDGVAIGEYALTSDTSVVIGQGAESVHVQVTPLHPASDGFEQEPTLGTSQGRLVGGVDPRMQPTVGESPPPPAQHAPPAPPAGAAPVDGQRPGGALAPQAAPPTVIPDFAVPDVVTVTLEGTSHVVRKGDDARIGRERDNTIVVDHSVVSRHHARLHHDDTGWVLVDMGSATGTWERGNRVSRIELSGRHEVVLGEPTTGLPVTLEAPVRSAAEPAPGSGQVAKRPGSKLLVPAIVGIVVLAVLAGAFAWTRDRGGLDQDRLARATVRIIDPSSGASGSGSIIDAKRGLILTNAHVAAPAASGTGVRNTLFEDEVKKSANPRQLLIQVAPGLDRAAQARFRAEVVAVDGYLDLAVIKIVQTLSSTQVDQKDLDDLTEVPVRYTDISSGESVTAVGFPGAAGSASATLTRGIVSGLVADARLSTNRAFINLDAQIAPGNSGGLAADSKGRLVGVPTRGRFIRANATSVGAAPIIGTISSMRPVALAKPLIDTARSGQQYTSPWASDLPAGAAITALRYTAPVTAGEVAAECGRSEPREGIVSFAVDYTGFTADKHTDVMALLYDKKDDVVGVALSVYPTAFPAAGCLTLTFQAEGAVPAGDYKLKIGAGANHRVLYEQVITYPAAPAPETAG